MNAETGIRQRFHLRRNELEQSRVRSAVTSGSAISGPYLAMNAAAALLAGLGLLQNSPAVIIGAMLVAMLFGPIVGIALGLAEASLPLLIRSLVSEFVGVVWVLGIGYGLGTVSTTFAIGSEILNRTTPSILDLLIGLVGGLAGAFTFVSADLPGVIVGVAIATALVPPLTSCGILMARGMHDLAAGAFLLFLANFTAIAVGAWVVLRLAGHRPPIVHGAFKILVARLISLALFVILAFHLTMTLHRTLARARLEATVEKTISAEMVNLPGARLVSVTVSRELPPLAWVVVRTPEALGPNQVARLNDVVNRATGTTLNLHVRSVITAETTRDGFVYQPRLSSGDDFVLP